MSNKIASIQIEGVEPEIIKKVIHIYWNQQQKIRQDIVRQRKLEAGIIPQKRGRKKGRKLPSTLEKEDLQKRVIELENQLKGLNINIENNSPILV